MSQMRYCSFSELCEELPTLSKIYSLGVKIHSLESGFSRIDFTHLHWVDFSWTINLPCMMLWCWACEPDIKISFSKPLWRTAINSEQIWLSWNEFHSFEELIFAMDFTLWRVDLLWFVYHKYIGAGPMTQIWICHTASSVTNWALESKQNLLFWKKLHSLKSGYLNWFTISCTGAGHMSQIIYENVYENVFSELCDVLKISKIYSLGMKFHSFKSGLHSWSTSCIDTGSMRLSLIIEKKKKCVSKIFSSWVYCLWTVHPAKAINDHSSTRSGLIMGKKKVFRSECIQSRPEKYLKYETKYLSGRFLRDFMCYHEVSSVRGYPEVAPDSTC